RAGFDGIGRSLKSSFVETCETHKQIGQWRCPSRIGHRGQRVEGTRASVAVVPVQRRARSASRREGIAIAAPCSTPQPGAIMATSSITGVDRAPSQATGRDVEALGPSDTSDSGSDVQGELDLAPPIDLDNPSGGSVQPGLQSDSDAAGAGERGAALLDEEAREGNDILP